MNIKDQITKDLLQARKNGNQQEASLLRTILGEFGRLPDKEVTNEKATAVLLKVEKNLKEVLKHGNEVARTEAEVEMAIVSRYLPKKMTVREMVSLYAMMSDDMNIGQWMKNLKEYCQENDLTFDGKDAKIVFESFED